MAAALWEGRGKRPAPDETCGEERIQMTAALAPVSFCRSHNCRPFVDGWFFRSWRSFCNSTSAGGPRQPVCVREHVELQLCSRTHKTRICVGPLWNVSAWEDVVLQGRLSSFGELRTRPHYSYSSHMSRNHFDSIEAIDAEIAQLQQETALRLKELQDKRAELQVVQGLVPLGNGSSRSRGFNSTYIFQFETRSSPAVLLMSVDPVSRAPRIGEDPPQLTPAALDDEHEGHHWSLEVKRIEPPPTGLNFQRTGYGTRIMTIEDMSQRLWMQSVNMDMFVGRGSCEMLRCRPIGHDL